MKECEVMKFWRVLELLVLGSSMLILKSPQAIMCLLFSVMDSMLLQTSWTDFNGAPGGR